MVLEKQEASAPVDVRPPRALQISRWFCFSATVAIAIGMLAMLDHHLTGLPLVYDGSRTEFVGRIVMIDYCLLSSSTLVPLAARCRLAFTAAAVSLALSLIWTYIQFLIRNPYKHKKARFADFILCLIATVWWIACGVMLSIWTHQANVAGLPRTDWRNGVCVLAWAEFLFFTFLAVTSALLARRNSQQMFDKWEAKNKLKKQQQEAAKRERLQKEAAEAEAAAAAATSHKSKHQHHQQQHLDTQLHPAEAPAIRIPQHQQQQQHALAGASTAASHKSAWPSSTAAAAAAAPGSAVTSNTRSSNKSSTPVAVSDTDPGAANPFLTDDFAPVKLTVGEHAV